MSENRQPTEIRSDMEPAEVAAAMAMRTPCCGARYEVYLEFVGSPYMQEQVVGEFNCADCDNVWHHDGTPSYIRVPSEKYAAFSFKEDGSVDFAPTPE